ncbi:MAG: ATP-binding protein [Planctomycetota bacterium]|nr:ATP-binding protein [Planctomycetota bacterium]
MQWFRNTSIANKFTLVTFVAITAPLVLCFAAFIISDLGSMKVARRHQAEALASVLAKNVVSAMEFDDQDTANQSLQSLSGQPTIKAALLYDRHGKVFARYPHDGTVEAAPHTDDSVLRVSVPVFAMGTLGNNSFLVDADPVIKTLRPKPDKHSGGECKEALSFAPNQIGSLMVLAGTDDIGETLMFRTFLSGLVFLFSLAIGIGLSMKLRRSITQPIYELLHSARRVAVEKDYRKVIPQTSGDELGELTAAYNELLATVQRSHDELGCTNNELEHRVSERTGELQRAIAGLNTEICERESLQQELVTASRQAGMAEVATGVLHNVGNVLNSVNVSANLVMERQQKSSLSMLNRATDVIREHATDLGSFVTEDRRGQQFPVLLAEMTAALNREAAEQQCELKAIIDNIEHIKEIVTTQQSFARVRGVIEKLSIADLIEDAIRINDSGLRNQGVVIEREVETATEVLTDKHKVLQILVNLVGNAKHALEKVDASVATRTLSTRVWQNNDDVQIDVRDNGVGISAENLVRVFSHGFTTKQDGHGFGLHSSALAAKELGGSLSVASDGVGQGAVFSLRIPLPPSLAAVGAMV